MNYFLNKYLNIIYEMTDPNSIKTIEDLTKALKDFNIWIGHSNNANNRNFKLIKFLKNINPIILKEYINYLNNKEQKEPDQYADGGAWWQEVKETNEFNESLEQLKKFFNNLKEMFKLEEELEQTKLSEIDEKDYKDKKFEHYYGNNAGNDFSAKKNKIQYNSNDDEKNEAAKNLMNSWNLPYEKKEKYEKILENDPNWKFTKKTNELLETIENTIALNATVIYKKTDNKQIKYGLKHIQSPKVDHWDVDWDNVQKDLVRNFYLENKTLNERKEQIQYWISALNAMKLNSIEKTFKNIQQKLNS